MDSNYFNQYRTESCIYMSVIDKIKNDIKNYPDFILCANGQKGIHIDKALEIIDKYTGGDKD